jgi:hypothetical protein
MTYDELRRLIRCAAWVLTVVVAAVVYVVLR